MDPAVLSQIPDGYKHLYQQNWNTIKTSVKRGLLKDVYHFPLLTTSNGEIVTRLQEMLAGYNNKIKVNVAFGFVLYDRINNLLKFFHPSTNTRFFDTPRLLANSTDFQKLADDIDHQDVVEYAHSQRPTNKWIVERIICVRFDIFKLQV